MANLTGTYMQRGNVHLLLFAVVVSGVVGCGGGEGGGRGTGGGVGAGGAIGTGGRIGSGGTIGTGGGPGAGGTPGSGGAVGSGGTVGTGGRAGAGGRAASGGTVGSGGTAGGAGAGGRAGGGGAVGSGGVAGTGGRAGAGGTFGTGGAAGGGGTGGAGTASAVITDLAVWGNCMPAVPPDPVRATWNVTISGAAASNASLSSAVLTIRGSRTVIQTLTVMPSTVAIVGGAGSATQSKVTGSPAPGEVCGEFCGQHQATLELDFDSGPNHFSASAMTGYTCAR